MPRGLKPVRRKLATGEVRLYWYHRATGKALSADPATAEGMLEVAELDAKVAKAEALSSAPREPMPSCGTDIARGRSGEPSSLAPGQTIRPCVTGSEKRPTRRCWRD